MTPASTDDHPDAGGSTNREAASGGAGPVPAEAPLVATAPREAGRFYDRLRQSIRKYLERKGPALGRTAEYLLLVPDVFILLWRLVNDPRVEGKHKVLLGSGIAYYIFPFDIVPEVLLGPLGYFDDLIFAVYVLNRMLVDTDPAILREHWAGEGDLLAMIRKVLGAADSLVSTDVLARIKKMVK